MKHTASQHFAVWALRVTLPLEMASEAGSADGHR